MRQFFFRSWRGLIGVASVAPLAIGPSGDFSDSSATRFAIAAGTGSYAVITRGCSGEVISKYKRDFHDAAASVEHEFRGPLVLGVRAQRISGPVNFAENGIDQVLWNPHAALEGRNFGVGAGFVTPEGELGNRYGPDHFHVPPLSAHLRFGDLRRAYLSIRCLEDEPAFSSGGLLTIRAGGRVSARSDVRAWLGVGSPEPFDAWGLLAGADIPIAPGLQMNVGGRLGISEGVNESAVRAGLSYTWTHRRYDFHPTIPAADSAGSGTLTITLEDGKTVSAVSVQPWVMGYIRVVLPNRTISFISDVKVNTIVDGDGLDVTKKVLTDRKKVP